MVIFYSSIVFLGPAIHLQERYFLRYLFLFYKLFLHFIFFELLKVVPLIVLVLLLFRLLIDSKVPKRHFRMTFDKLIANVDILLCILDLPSVPRYHGSIVQTDLLWTRKQLFFILFTSNFKHFAEIVVASHASN